MPGRSRLARHDDHQPGDPRRRPTWRRGGWNDGLPDREYLPGVIAGPRPQGRGERGPKLTRRVGLPWHRRPEEALDRLRGPLLNVVGHLEAHFGRGIYVDQSL